MNTMENNIPKHIQESNEYLSQLLGKTVKKIEWSLWIPNGPGNTLEIVFNDDFRLNINLNSLSNPVQIQEPEGYNGPGMYETYTKAFEMNFLDGHKNVLTINGEKTHPECQTVRFHAESLEHAKSLLNLEEVEYVKWVSKWPLPVFDGN